MNLLTTRLARRCREAMYVCYAPRINRPALRQLSKLRSSERIPRADLDSLQRSKLLQLIDFARTHVPYYSSIDSDLSSHAHGSASEILSSFPVLTKEDVRNAGPSLLAPKCGRVFLASTGGSTGEPLHVTKSLRSVVMAEAALVRGMEWSGYRIGDRGIHLKTIARFTFPGRVRQKLRNERSFSIYGNHSECRSEIESITSFRPQFVMGYVSSLTRLAESVDGGPLTIPIIYSTGETLQNAHRKTIENSLGGRVYDYYGSNEVSSLAYECQFGCKHVTEEHVVLEVLDKNDTPVWDQPGRIVVTDLDNEAMPLIRYEIGDIGVMTREQCRCGRSLRVLKQIQGRTQDVIRSSSGNLLPSIWFASRFRELHQIRSYQVVQHAIDQVEIRFVPNGENALGEIERMRSQVEQELGGETCVTAVEVNSIELTPRGKSRLVHGFKPT